MADAGEGSGIGAQLPRVDPGPLLGLPAGFYPVGLVVEDDELPVLLPEAVRHALEQHLLPGVHGLGEEVPRVAEQGELKLPAERGRGEHPLPQGGGEERPDGLGVHGVSLPRREEARLPQPLDFAPDAVQAPGPGKVHILQHQVGGGALLGPGERLVAPGKVRQPEGAAGLGGEIPGVLVGSRPALQLRGCDLGGQALRGGMGVTEGKLPPQRLLRVRVRLHRGQGVRRLPGLLRLPDQEAQMLLPVPESRAQEPEQGALHPGQQRRRHGSARQNPRLFYKPLRVLCGGGEEEPLLGPGHAHVEQPQLLRQHLPIQPQGDGGPGKAGVFHPALQIRDLGAQPQLRVHQNGAAAVLAVKAVGQVGEEDHGKLQPLGLVDGEDMYGGAALRAERGLLPPLGHAPQPEHEAVQPPVAGSLKALGELHQLQKPRPALLAVPHGAAHRQQIQLLQNALRELGGPQIRRLPAQPGKQREEIPPPGVRLRPGLEGGEEIHLSVRRADGGEGVRVKADGGGAEYRDQGDVLVGIVENGQHRHHRGHLRRPEEAPALAEAHGDPQALQLLPVDGAYVVGGAEQDGDIAVVQGTAVHLQALGHQPADLAGHEGGLLPELVRRLLLAPAGGKAQQRELRHGDAAGVARGAEAQGGGIVIVHIAKGFGHAAGKDRVGRVQDLLPGAEILPQQDAAGLAGGGLVIIGKALIF